MFLTPGNERAQTILGPMRRTAVLNGNRATLFGVNVSGRNVQTCRQLRPDNPAAKQIHVALNNSPSSVYLSGAEKATFRKVDSFYVKANCPRPETVLPAALTSPPPWRITSLR